MKRRLDTKGLAALVATAAFGLVAACSTETIDPVTRFAADEPSVDAGSSGESPPPDAAPPGPIKRTVSKQNPFGGPAGNLLVDGDFELSAAPDEHTGQYGWVGLSNDAQKNFKMETGGLCRTGLRCAVLEPKMYLFGRGAAAAGGAGNVASIFAKLPAGDACALIKAYLIPCDAATILKQLKGDAQPDAQGWCEYNATTPPQDVALCLFVDGTALKPDHDTLIDSALLLPDDGTYPASGGPWTPTAEEMHRLAVIREHIRRNLPLGRSPVEHPRKLERVP